MDGVRGAALQVRGFELCGRGPGCSAESEGVRVMWTGSGMQWLHVRGIELCVRWTVSALQNNNVNQTVQQ